VVRSSAASDVYKRQGFIDLKVENHFVSKYWTAYKPL
jgi:hypothetical protein